MTVIEIETGNNAARLKVGDLVRTVWGKTGTIFAMDDGRVFVAADPDRPVGRELNNWYHPTKVWPVSRKLK